MVNNAVVSHNSVNELYYLEEVDSTNTWAKANLDKFGPVGAVYTTSQTAGRGRRGHTWINASGQALYYTVVLKTELAQPESLPLFASMAVADALEQRYGIQCQIKWPNDLYLDHRKVAGILCESVIPPGAGGATRVLVGVGVNVNSRVNDFPGELRPLVTTVREHIRAPLSLQDLLPRFVQAISDQVARLGNNRAAILADWQRYDYLAGREVVCTVGMDVRKGVAAGLNEEGRYRLRDPEGCVHEVIGGQLRLRAASLPEDSTGPGRG